MIVVLVKLSKRNFDREDYLIISWNVNRPVIPMFSFPPVCFLISVRVFLGLFYSRSNQTTSYSRQHEFQTSWTIFHRELG